MANSSDKDPTGSTPNANGLNESGQNESSKKENSQNKQEDHTSKDDQEDHTPEEDQSKEEVCPPSPEETGGQGRQSDSTYPIVDPTTGTQAQHTNKDSTQKTPAELNCDADIDQNEDLMCHVNCKHDRKEETTDDVIIIQCCLCTKWFHIDCVDITPKQLKKIEFWPCLFCRNISKDVKMIQKMLNSMVGLLDL